MRFRCDVCGQRYSTGDEPAAGRTYRVPCAACRGSIVISGGDYPAMPTTLGVGFVPVDAGDSPPLDVTIGPLARERAPSPPASGRRPPRHPRPMRQRSILPAAGAAAALVLLLMAGGPLLCVPRPSGVRAPAAGPSPVPPVPPSLDPAGSAAQPVAMPRSSAPLALDEPETISVPPAAVPARPATPQAPLEIRAVPAPAPGANASAHPGPERALARLVPRSMSHEPPRALRASAESAPPPPAATPPGPPLRAPPPPAAAPPTATAAVPGALPRSGEPPPPTPGPQPPAAAQPPPPPVPGLAEEQVAAVVFHARVAFQTCAGRAPGVPEEGRRVSLSFTVTPAGHVASPDLDDPQLRETPLGRCLLDAGRRLVFPAFRGDPFPVSVPLVFSVPRS